jgi:hypothetical protein
MMKSQSRAGRARENGRKSWIPNEVIRSRKT